MRPYFENYTATYSCYSSDLIGRLTRETNANSVVKVASNRTALEYEFLNKI